MNRARLHSAVVLAIALIVTPGAAFAGSVRIEEAGVGRIAVDADDAMLDEIVASIGETHGFSIKRVGAAAKSEPVSGRFEGTLASVLSQLLQAENHAIEYAAHTHSGIARVTLYTAPGLNVGGTPSRPATAGTAGQPGPLPLSRRLDAPQPVQRAVPQKPITQPQAVQTSEAAAQTVAPQRRRGGAIN
jgi:hypothetical protein